MLSQGVLIFSRPIYIMLRVILGLLPSVQIMQVPCFTVISCYRQWLVYVAMITQVNTVGINQELQTEESGPDRNTANHRIKKAQVGITHVANQIYLVLF